jgi:hypothetical protein
VLTKANQFDNLDANKEAEILEKVVFLSNQLKTSNDNILSEMDQKLLQSRTYYE